MSSVLVSSRVCESVAVYTDGVSRRLNVGVLSVCDSSRESDSVGVSALGDGVSDNDLRAEGDSVGVGSVSERVRSPVTVCDSVRVSAAVFLLLEAVMMRVKVPSPVSVPGEIVERVGSVFVAESERLLDGEFVRDSGMETERVRDSDALDVAERGAECDAESVLSGVSEAVIVKPAVRVADSVGCPLGDLLDVRFVLVRVGGNVLVRVRLMLRVSPTVSDMDSESCAEFDLVVLVRV